MIHFAATEVVVDRSDKDYILVGFAEVRDGQHHEALHFQRSYEFHDQDVALGMGQVYVERNDQSQSGYGGIERVELNPGRIRIVLSGSTARALGDTHFEIALRITPARFEELKEGLRLVFEGFDVFRNEAF